MHETYFGLRKRPFLATPTLDRYCPIECQESAYTTAVRAIQRAEGPVSIIGGTGLGKSMVCLRIADTFRRSFEVIVLASSQLCSRRALLQSLLFELRMPYRDLSEGELRLSLLERLQPSNDNPTDGLVLIVDEAHTLAPKLLEELRLITNLTRDGVPRVRLVLCGTTRLEELLGHPQMESLNQRLAARCYLLPLNSQETTRYLTHKIELCGAPISAVITEDAIRLVHRATDGVPRLIDQVVDSALRIAAELKQRPVSVQTIEAAWARSQQLPLPWSDKAQSISDSPTSIEFGLLEDDTEQDFRGSDTSYVHHNPGKAVHSSVSDDELYGQIDEPENTSTPQATYDSEMATYEESIGLASKPTQHLPPVPSAGSGLSRSISNAWDSFVEPAPKGIDDSFDYAVDHSNEHLLMQASSQSPKYSQSFDAEPADRYPQHGSGTQNSTIANDIFGMDYEEELWLSEPSASTLPIKPPSQNQSPQIISPMTGASSGFDVPIDVVSDDTIDKLLYAFRDAPQQQNVSGHTEFHKVRAYQDETESALELLDQISSVNLEAMTMSTQDSSGVMNGITNHQEPTLEVVTENSVVRSPKSSFGGVKSAHATLSRPPRPSILSFAEMQNESSELIRDDRDLLVIEEDVLQMNAGVPVGASHDSMSQASVHPYKQLFSKLRG
ncbi:MAG: AAA family ATPase [Planctomycetota bacterium]|nr:AAA family ATPase [Planctomycetota bacterium]